MDKTQYSQLLEGAKAFEGGFRVSLGVAVADLLREVVPDTVDVRVYSKSFKVADGKSKGFEVLTEENPGEETVLEVRLDDRFFFRLVYDLTFSTFKVVPEFGLGTMERVCYMPDEELEAFRSNLLSLVRGHLKEPSFEQRLVALLTLGV